MIVSNRLKFFLKFEAQTLYLCYSCSNSRTESSLETLVYFCKEITNYWQLCELLLLLYYKLCYLLSALQSLSHQIYYLYIQKPTAFLNYTTVFLYFRLPSDKLLFILKKILNISIIVSDHIKINIFCLF